MTAAIHSQTDAPAVLVRDATAADGEAIRCVIASAYHEYERVLSPDLYAAYLADLLAIADQAAALQLVAEIGGEVVGTVTFYPDAAAAEFGFPAGWSSLRALAVDPACRGHGAGKALVAACVERAVAVGAPTIGLHTAQFMTAAIVLYERFGFTRVPTFDVNAVDMINVDDPDGPLVIAYRRQLVAESDDYPLGRSAEETQRLILQHQIYSPLTRQFLVAAGITRGMKVLDLGSGAGDVAMLVADLVGPQGRVVGVDANAAILDTARARAAAAGLANVEFVRGDLDDLDVDDDFDAVVGRWILMYLADPADLLRRVRAHLRPGAIIAFQESADLTAPIVAFPPTPLHDDVVRWTTPPAGLGGPITNMGLRLYGAFVDAGLVPPQLRNETPIGGGPDWPGYAYVAGSIRSLLPVLEQLGTVTAVEVDVDTLEARLRAEAVERNSVQALPTVIGAWARCG